MTCRGPGWSCLLLVAGVAAAQEGWPTKAHDARRTAQSEVRGPQSPAFVGSRAVADGQFINMAATVASDGTAYFGSWGVIRSPGVEDRSLWDKFDGQLFAWRPRGAGFQEWFGPGRLDLVPMCHDYAPGSTPSACPAPEGAELSWWNGTVEGTASLSPDEATVYAGRGDGKLYALDARGGSRRWTFRTCNDALDCNLPSTNPESGGEIVAGTLLRGAEELYVASYGVSGSTHPETSALYRVDAASGRMAWRYPASGGVSGVFVAAPALSPDGGTIYAANFCDPFPCQAASSLWAFQPDGKLRWQVPLQGDSGEKLGAWSLAVGQDGVIYVGGGGANTCTGAFVAAYRPSDGQRVWGPVFLPSGFAAPCSNIAGGLALREVGGRTARLYATTNFIAEFSILGRPGGGRLFALDPATGLQPWGSPFFDPGREGGFGNMVYPTLDRDGTIFTGASGAYQTGLQAVAYRVETPGWVYAVRESGELLWKYQLRGAITWSNPVLGPAGVLYVGDSRARLVGRLEPIGDPIYEGLDLSPEFYSIAERAPAVSDAVGQLGRVALCLLALALGATSAGRRASSPGSPSWTGIF